MRNNESPTGANPDVLTMDQERRDRAERLVLVALEAERVAEIPPRIWFIDGLLTPGFCILSAKKGIGKSYFALEAAYAIGEGAPFLGRATSRARVLYVPFELDRTAMHERAQRFGPCPENVLVHYGWSRGDEALKDAEAAIRERGVKVLIFDMFLAVLPPGLETNSYDSSPVFLAWRRMALQYGAAIVAVWHSGKGDREDPMLGPIGSTGFVGQADCILTLDRKRGETGGRLFIGGNHGREETLSVNFADCRWTLAGENAEGPRLAQADKAIADILETRPEGLSTSTLAATLGKAPNSVRAGLSRLATRGLVLKRRSRWTYTPPKAHEAHESARSLQSALFGDGQAPGQSARNAPPPLGGRALSCAFPEPRTEGNEEERAESVRVVGLSEAGVARLDEIKAEISKPPDWTPAEAEAKIEAFRDGMLTQLALARLRAEVPALPEAEGGELEIF